MCVPLRVWPRGVADWLQTIICRCILEKNSTIEILRWFENAEEKHSDGEVGCMLHVLRRAMANRPLEIQQCHLVPG